MKKILFYLSLGVLLVGISLAQVSAPVSSSSQDSAAPGAQSNPQDSKTSASSSQQGKAAEQGTAAASSQLPPGSMIYAELAKSLDAKKAKQGDEVTAKTTEAVLSQGRVLLPRGSKIMGHVVDAKPREKDQAQSQLALVFDHAVLKDGSQVPLGSLAIQAIGTAQVNPSAPDDTMSGTNSGMPSGSGMGGMGTAGGRAGTTGGMGGNYPSGPGVQNSPGSTAGNVGNSSGTGTAGAPGGGHLNGSSRGVVGMPGLQLASSGQSSVITSDSKNVKLDSGIEMVLRVQ